MALHFPLMINGTRIGQFYAVRTAGGTNPDDINTYEVEVIDGSHKRLAFVTVDHRYGDGAWELVRKALKKVGEA